jgi:cytochrome c
MNCRWKRKSKRVLGLLLLSLAACRSETVVPAPAAASAALAGDAKRGQQIAAQYSCNVCHIMPGVSGPQGSLGPSLVGLASRPAISNDTVQNTPENLARFIENPPALNPSSTMPAMGIPAQDARDLAAFVLTLK